MVCTYKSRSQFEIPYSVLCPVYFLRYPNPLASHVLSVDVLSREVVSRPIGGGKAGEGQQQHVLKTTRLILKRGTLPKWAPRGVIRNAESWVLEESEVDLDPLSPTVVEQQRGVGREMKSWTRNLDHTTVMAVTERNIFRERWDQASQSSFVGLKSKSDVTSGVAFGLLRSRIEKFGLNRVVTHVDTGILATHARFLEQRLGVLPEVPLGQSQSLSPHSTTVSKRARLLAALRPPFLDGDFVGPIARMKQRILGVREWWGALHRGGTGDEGSLRVRSSSQRERDAQEEAHLTPTERLRKRFLKLRDQSRSRRSDEDDDDDDY